MNNSIIYSAVFVRRAKIFKKKHLSLVEDLYELEQNLLDNPLQGNDLAQVFIKLDLQLKVKVRAVVSE
jgi:hypothetical protein